MKKHFKIALLSVSTIFGLHSPSFAQYANPAGMRYVGSQQYMGQNAMFVNPYQRTQYVAPQINSIYAKPMNRVTEIPFYGKNKNMYFYNQKKKDEGPFADSGLYMFAAFSTGKNNNGVNLEHGEVDNGEADANDSMGDPEGISLGVGRVMSNTLSVEFMYSNYTKMSFGNWVKFNDTKEEPILDEDGEETDEVEEIPFVDDNTYEVTSGGNISSSFIGVGFKYNLENMFGTLLGRLKPYFGFQLGIAQNTIGDYVVDDKDGYVGDDYVPDITDDLDYIKELEENTFYTAEEYYNGELTFIGASTRSLAYGAELGFSVELEGNLSIDIFYKMNNYGKVKTSGNMLSVYDLDTTKFYVMKTDDLEQDVLESSNPCSEPGFSGTYKDGAAYIVCVAEPETEEGIQSLTQRRVSSGDMNFYQYGIKLKYMF